MSKLSRAVFIASTAGVLAVSAPAAASAAPTGSAGYFGNPECLIQQILTYGTISAGDGAFFLPGCRPF